MTTLRAPAVPVTQGAARRVGHVRLARVARVAPPGVAVLALLACLVAAGSAPQAPPGGLADAGAVVRWAVPLGRLAVDALAVVTLGALLVATVLSPPRTDAVEPGSPAARARRGAVRWSAAWAVAAASLAAVTTWDVTGVPPLRLSPGELVSAAWAMPATRALVMVAVLAAVLAAVAPVCLRHGSPAARALALAVAVAALVPPLYVGHAAHAAEHGVATGGLVVHVMAATVWLGGLAGLVLYVRSDPDALPGAAERFSTVALAAFGSLVASGLLVAAASLGTSASAWTSPYAALLAVKVTAAGLLGLVGGAHRRWTLARLRAGRPRAFVRLAGAELVLMGAAMGAAVALSRTPGATGGGLLERSTRVVGPGAVVPTVPARDLVVDWRPEPVLTVVAVLALAAYLRAVHGLRRGVPAADPAADRLPSAWPRARTAAAVAGVSLLVVAAGVPTGYDLHPLVALRAGQLAVMFLAVPALLAGAHAPALHRAWAPAQAQDAAGRAGPAVPLLPLLPAGRARSVLTEPGTGFVVLVVATVTALAGPWRTPGGGTLPDEMVLVGLLAGGAVFCTSVLGLGSAAPRPVRDRAPVVALSAMFLAGFGVVLSVGGLLADPAAVAGSPPGGPVFPGESVAAGVVLVLSGLVIAVPGLLAVRSRRGAPTVPGVPASSSTTSGAPAGR